MDLRNAEEAEIELLARIWHEGWYEAHALILPAELTKFRTLESFEERLRDALSNIRVAGPHGDPAGFSIVKDDELYQLYVSQQWRGSGVAAALIADAEARLAERGVEIAWLACAIGNARAERFYEKQGWSRVGTMRYSADTSNGSYPLDVWRYEKALRRFTEPSD